MAGRGLLSKVLISLGSFRNVLTTRIAVTACQQQNAGLKADTKEWIKNLKIPEQPKRPLSPYFRFLGEHRSLVQKEHPDWKIMEVSKQCAEDWNKLDGTIKTKYRDEYAKDLAIYQSETVKFASLLTQEQKDALLTVKREKRASKKKRETKKVYRETSKPKRPIGSFLYFVKEKWALPENKDKKLAEMLTAVKDEWKNISPTQKEKYLKLNDADRQRYQQQMQEWEAKMINEGMPHLIRKDKQILSDTKPSHLAKPKPKGSS